MAAMTLKAWLLLTLFITYNGLRAAPHSEEDDGDRDGYYEHGDDNDYCIEDGDDEGSCSDSHSDSDSDSHSGSHSDSHSEENDDKRKHNSKEKQDEKDKIKDKQHHSKEHHSKEHPSKEHPSKEHPSKEHHSKEHPSKEHHSKEHPSKEHHSKEHPSKEHPSKEHHSKEHPSKEHASKEHPSKEHHSKEHPSKENKSKKDHSQEDKRRRHCIQKKCRIKYEELPEDEKVKLQYILQFLVYQDGGAYGNFFFYGKYIPIGFVLTYIQFQGENISQINTETLSDIILIYMKYFNIVSRDDDIAYDISNEDLVILKLIQNYIQDEDDWPNKNANVIIRQYNIPTSYIVSSLNSKGIGLEDVSVEQIYYIINTYIRENHKQPEIGRPLGTEPTGEQQRVLIIILQFLGTQNDGSNIVFTFEGNTIRAEIVMGSLRDENKNATTSNVGDLWSAIKVCIQTTETTAKPLTPDEELLQEFISIISDPDKIKTSYINYNNQKISVNEIIEKLNLHVNNETGTYDTQNVAVTDFIRVIQDIVQEIDSDVTTQPSSQDKQFVQYFLNALSDPDKIKYGYLLYNSYSIPLQEIADGLGLTVDDKTGMYNIRNVTSADILNVVQGIIKTMKSTKDEE